jgi:purine-nucleoside phosphorylase
LSTPTLAAFFENFKPDVYVVCGSGFKAVVEAIPSFKQISMNDVFCSGDKSKHQVGVPGHGSELRLCRIGTKLVCFQTGRYHMYQGYNAFQVAEPIFVAAKAGVKNFIVTNAAGGLHEGLRPGDIVVLSDFINLTGDNCLIGTEYAVKFVDMKNAFSKQWNTALIKKKNLKQAIYCGLKGPTFETAAETRYLRTIGADVVGMSTVQEVIAARACGCHVLALSFVSNLCGDLNSDGSSHQEVLDSGKQFEKEMAEILHFAIDVCPP